MRRKMTPTVAALIAMGWMILAVAQFADGQQDPLHNRHFWLGVVGIMVAVAYMYRWRKLSAAAKEEQGEAR